jgi:choline dehydrogenase-like flavoprotein
VLDLDCKAHDLDNLYVVDASFFPSCGAFNPALTIAANALRVGDRIISEVLNNGEYSKANHRQYQPGR